MPGIKEMNCSSASLESVGSTTGREGWKSYDNPFFVAAVASAVVEATLHQKEMKNQQQNHQEQDTEKAVQDDHEQDQKEAVPKNRKKREITVASITPRAAAPRTTRPSSVQKSPELVKKKQPEDTNQKLRAELLKAWTAIERLEKEHAAAKMKISRLSRRLEDGKAMRESESELQDKTSSSLQTMKHRLKEEKDSNKSLELANQKLEEELLEIRKAIAEAKKEMISERNSKKMIEEVCDELAKEVGQDRALVLELQKQSAAARREADDTRKALQMGEVWKEEKVQGRLLEARFSMEERSMQLEKVRSEVEMFLKQRMSYDVERRMQQQEGSCSSSVGSSGSNGCSLSVGGEEKKAYREQTRLLLNGSGVHMRMSKAAYGGGGNGRTGFENGGGGAAAAGGAGGVPRIWPRMSEKRGGNF